MSYVLRLAATVAAYYYSFGTAVVLTLAANEMDRREANRKARDAWNASLKDQMVLIKGGVQPVDSVYGRTCKSGVLLYASTSGSKKEVLHMIIALAGHECDALESVILGDQTVTLDGSGNVTSAPYATATNDQWRYQAVTVPASAPYQVTLPFTPVAINAIRRNITGDGQFQVVTGWSNAGALITFPSTEAGKTVWVDYYTATSATYAKVIWHSGSPTQTADSTLTAAVPSEWTSTDRLRGICYAYVQLTFNETAFPNGIPAMRFVLRGKKLFDPRTSTTAWSQNAALVARDYLNSADGLNISTARIDDATVITAANICDENVQITATPTYQARYTVDGVISAAADRLQMKASIEDAMAGRIAYIQGKYKVRAGAYTTPAFTIDESMLADALEAIEIEPFQSRSEVANRAFGTFLSPSANWTQDTFPGWTNAALVTEDNGADYPLECSYPLVIDPTRAQRLAKIAVLKTRDALTVKLSCNWSAWRLAAGDMVYVKITRYGWSAMNAGAGKAFRVVDRGFSTETGLVQLVLREESSTLYDWNFADTTAYTASPNTTLPNPTTVAAPTVVAAYSGQSAAAIQSDGTVMLRIRVAVTVPSDVWVLSGGRIELEYIAGAPVDSSLAWVQVPPVVASETNLYIDNVRAGAIYTIRVRVRNTLGAVSGWTYTTHTVTGWDGSPPDVSSLTVSVLPDGTRKFTAIIPAGIAALSPRLVIAYQSGSSPSWGSMSALVTLPISPGQTQVDYQTNEPVAGTWSFGAKLLTALGIYSTTPAYITGAVLGNSPVTYGSVVNLLQNADFSENTGTDSGATCLRGWSYVSTITAGANLGRNYTQGQRYNVGKGGCYLTTGTSDVGNGHYHYIAQFVAAEAGIEYEASVWYAAHRCTGTPVQLSFYDGSNALLGSVTQYNTTNTTAANTFDPPSGGSDGPTPGAVSPMSFAWVKATAPATTAKARLAILSNTMNAGSSSEGYLFAHRAMVCRARTGATYQTPSPWVDSVVTGVNGGQIDSGSVDTTQITNGAATYVASTTWSSAGPLAASHSPDDFFWWTAVATISYTPPVSGTVIVHAAAECAMGLSGAGPLSAGTYAMISDGVESFGTAAATAQFPLSASSLATGESRKGQLSIRRAFTVTGGVTYTWKLYGKQINADAYFNNGTMTVEHIKK